MEEDKYYVIYKSNVFFGFLIAKDSDDVRKEIAYLGEEYTTNGTYITKKSKTGKD